MKNQKTTNGQQLQLKIEKLQEQIHNSSSKTEMTRLFLESELDGYCLTIVLTNELNDLAYDLNTPVDVFKTKSQKFMFLLSTLYRLCNLGRI